MFKVTYMIKLSIFQFCPMVLMNVKMHMISLSDTMAMNNNPFHGVLGRLYSSQETILSVLFSLEKEQKVNKPTQRCKDTKNLMLQLKLIFYASWTINGILNTAAFFILFQFFGNTSEGLFTCFTYTVENNGDNPKMVFHPNYLIFQEISAKFYETLRESLFLNLPMI